jgi:hypothetical protein
MIYNLTLFFTSLPITSMRAWLMFAFLTDVERIKGTVV